MPITCPYCNNNISLEIIVNPKKMEEETFFITRKEYSVDQSRSEEETLYNILGYEADKDRFRVNWRLGK